MKAIRGRCKSYYCCFKHSEYGNTVCQNSRYEPEVLVESYLLSNIEKAIEDYNIRITKNATQPKDTAKIKKKMEKLKDLRSEEHTSELQSRI